MNSAPNTTVATSPPAAVGWAWLWLAAVCAAYWIAALVYRPWQTAAPDLAMAHSRLASDLADAGRLTDAIDQCRAALALRPDAVPARYNLALYLRRTGESAEAEAELRRLVAAAPKFVQARIMLGTMLAERGETAAAAEVWQPAADHPVVKENLRRLRLRSPGARPPGP